MLIPLRADFDAPTWAPRVTIRRHCRKILRCCGRCCSNPGVGIHAWLHRIEGDEVNAAY